MSTPDAKQAVSLAGRMAKAGAHAIQQEHTGVSPLAAEAIDHHVWRFLTREQLFSILDEPYSPSADQ